MVKVGELIVKNNKYALIWYTDNINERVDIIRDMEFYQPINTDNCQCSYLSGNPSKIHGDRSLLTRFLQIKRDASSLHVPEQRDIKIENGQVIMTVTKEDDAGLFSYVLETTNGKISKEYYKSKEDKILITTVSNTLYNHSDKPVNYSLYEDLNSLYKATNTVTKSFYSAEELLRIYPEVSHVLKEDYVVIRSFEEAEERLNTWINSKEQLKSFDIESTGTDWGPTSQCRITGVFLGLGEHWSTYFPVRQDTFEYNLPVDYLRKIMMAINNQPPAPEVIILAHNSMFEIQGFYQEFREYVRCDVDTYLLAILENPVIGKGTHTLKALTNRADGKFYLSLNHIFTGPIQFNVLPPDVVKLYGCPDATSPAKVYKYLMERIPKDERFVIKLENKLPVIKAMNTFYGIKLNQDRLDVLIETTNNDADMLKKKFMALHKITGNINSTDVIRDVLYNKLKCKVEVYTSTGQPAVSKSAIDRILKLGRLEVKDDTIIPEDIMSSNGKVLVKGKDLAANRYPSLIIYQTYKSLLKKIGALRRLKNKSVAGFFKFYINQSGAGSNRQTSDAHQFDDTMKSCAVADSPYHGLVSCDWKQVELRILAGAAGQKDLIELEKDPSVDIHRAILSIITGKPMYMISEEDRKAGKSVNFGVVYMMSEYGLAAGEHGPGYTKEQLNAKRKAIADFFNGLPNIKMFVKGNEQFLRENGYIKTLFNYYRYFPALLDPTVPEKDKKTMIRAGNNTPIQGTGAQMLKIVECNVWEYIKKKGWDKCKEYDGIMLPMVRMILPIHDEILLSYDKTIPKEEIITMFKECMELEIDDMPPFFAAPAFINNWLDGKDSAFEVDIEVRDRIVENWKKGIPTFTEDNYLSYLTECREREISDYMDNLIATHVTEEEVIKHVTDDNLTHVLIETMMPSKAERKKYSHTERIAISTKRYMEGTKKDATNTTDEEVEDIRFATFEDWVDECVAIDSNGDIIETGENEADEYYDVLDADLIYSDTPVEDCRILYGLNEVIVDLTGYGEKEYRKLLALCDDNAFYNIILLQNGKMVKTDFKIAWIPDKIEEIFKED